MIEDIVTNKKIQAIVKRAIVCSILIKTTVTDQIKILHRKINQNEAQYYLERKAAKICAFRLETRINTNI